MTTRQELLNMVKVKAAKADRTTNRDDTKRYIEELASEYSRLAKYLYQSCSLRSRKAFITRAYKLAREWQQW